MVEKSEIALMIFHSHLFYHRYELADENGFVVLSPLLCFMVGRIGRMHALR